MKRSRILFLLAFLLTVVATFFLYRYVESLRKVPEVKVEYGNVMVAQANIPDHIKITEEMIGVKSVPVEAIHPDAARVAADLVGLTTKVEIFSGEQILKSKVATAEENLGLAYQIPENMRAIVVPTSEVSGLAGYLQKGDRVDILVTYSNRPGPSTPPAATTPGDTTPTTTPVDTQNGEPIEGYVETITQFQNIEILAIGVRAVNENGQVVVNQGVPSSVVLLVTPQQAEVVSYMLGSGSFQMTLRNPVDGLKVPLDHFGTDNFNDWRNR